MVAPLLQAQIDIDAPAAKVWALISDFRRRPEWSQRYRWTRLLGPLRQGTRTLNINRGNWFFSVTTCTVIAAIPEQKLAVRSDLTRTAWSYELEPNGTGTRVTKTRQAEDGGSALSNAFRAGTTTSEDELLEGMNTSLANLKAAAERG